MDFAWPRSKFICNHNNSMQFLYIVCLTYPGASQSAQLFLQDIHNIWNVGNFKGHLGNDQGHRGECLSCLCESDLSQYNQWRTLLSNFLANMVEGIEWFCSCTPNESHTKYRWVSCFIVSLFVILPCFFPVALSYICSYRISVSRVRIDYGSVKGEHTVF